MALFQEAQARSYFESLSDDQKTHVIQYVHDGNSTGDEAKHKIDNAVEHLKKHTIDFIN